MPGRIPRAFIDDLLARLDIVDVINERVTLKKSGANYMACCPFHNEKTPSFSVSQPKQFYHCFGCGANGSAIGFLMEYENMHFVDAVETLAESVGMDVPRDESAARHVDESRPLYSVLEAVGQWYVERLRETPIAIGYLKQRGLSGETAKRFLIGYAPDGWNALQQAFPDQEASLLKTGMLIRGDANKAPYQRFRNRIMFPIRDRRGRIIGFGGRVLDNSEPKYLNSPETPLFHKGSELYGLHEGRRASQEQGRVIVVEGYMDVVALARHGIENAVATLGTAANQQHSETLFRVVPNIVFCFDGDTAGRAAAWRALTATLPCLQDGRDAHFLFLPEGEDPDSIVSNEGAAGFADRMGSRQPIIDFLYEHLSSSIDDPNSVGGKARLADKAKPLVQTIPKGVYRQLALRRLETLIGLPLGSERAGAPTTPPPRSRREANAPTAMSQAALLVLQHPTVVTKQPPEAFEFDESLPGGEVLSRLIAYCDAEPTITTARLLERFRGSDVHGYLQRLAVRPYSNALPDLDTEAAATELGHCLRLLRRRSQQQSLDRMSADKRIGLLSIPRR